MERQVLLDKLSELLMVGQGAVQLYRVARDRALDPDLGRRYEEFGRQAARHRAVLVRLVERLGGDPSYVSPSARLAQVKAESLLGTSRFDGLSRAEVEANDLENLLLAETAAHAGFRLLGRLAGFVEDRSVRQALEEAVREVEPEEDRHLAATRDALARTGLRVLLEGPAPSPARWQRAISGPAPPITEVHPAPMGGELLLEGARRPMWLESPIVRAVRAG